MVGKRLEWHSRGRGFQSPQLHCLAQGQQLKRYCAFDPLPSSAEVFKFLPGVARTVAVRRLLGAGPVPPKYEVGVEKRVSSVKPSSTASEELRGEGVLFFRKFYFPPESFGSEWC